MWHNRSYMGMYELCTEVKAVTVLPRFKGSGHRHPTHEGGSVKNLRPYFKMTTLSLDTNPLSKFNPKNNLNTCAKPTVQGTM